ncbi:hypothetical protein [Caenibius sp. WL]|uniref:hypothetical protein n=1 Tax=Caenibius sp. WL TaxID=2872646 RepID=UPI001C99BA0F|nr:hypothetical protein [Caenibius sp. WL]QZP08982.1 hypothetical protein K5X80_04155 [Caenibius sp. WL]
MSKPRDKLLISECRIVAGRHQAFWYAVEPDKKVWNLMLEEDPAGFVGVPVRMEATVSDSGDLIPLSLERL